MDERYNSTPDFIFIDTILLVYRLGYVRYEEQKFALIAAARAANDAISFLSAIDNFGIGKRTELYKKAGEILSAYSYYKASYPLILGLRHADETPESFVSSQRVLFLPEALLTKKQQQLFYDTYWWFVHNHQAVYSDPKKGRCIGVWATASKDNKETIPRFENYLLRLINHQNKTIRTKFENFPADIILMILKRAFL